MSERAEVNDAKAAENEAGGSGGRNARAESGLSEIRDARMTARAIEQGWIGASRWDTHKPKSQLIQEIKERGDVTLAERTTLAVYELLENRDDRPKGIGARCAIAMERMNQIDEHAAVRASLDPCRPEAITTLPEHEAGAMDTSIPFCPRAAAG